MESAILTIPKLITKKVWVGLYGGHYKCMVIFSKQPWMGSDGYVDIIDSDINRLAIGSLEPTTFIEWFNVTGKLKDYLENPKEVYIYDTMEIELTAPYDEWDKIAFYDGDMDDWTR